MNQNQAPNWKWYPVQNKTKQTNDRDCGQISRTASVTHLLTSENCPECRFGAQEGSVQNPYTEHMVTSSDTRYCRRLAKEHALHPSPDWRKEKRLSDDKNKGFYQMNPKQTKDSRAWPDTPTNPSIRFSWSQFKEACLRIWAKYPKNE